MSKKFKVGIIGCGGIAGAKHLPALANVEEVEIVAFCDIVEERAIEAKKKFGTDSSIVYTDYKKLLEDSSIDTIHVCTPNKSHAPITIDALNAGKHVMCEKPMAKTYTDAKAMLDAAKKNNKILTIGYQNRCLQESLYLKKACENDFLGEIYFAKAHAVRRRAVPTWGVFLNEEEQGGGPLIDIGTHALDLTLWMMNNYEPKSVMGNVYKKLSQFPDSGNAWGPWKKEEYTVEDSAFGFITMKNGATIMLESSWALNTLDFCEGKTTLCGTKGGADMRDGLRFNFDELGRLSMKKPDLSATGVAYYGSKVMDASEIECRNFYGAIENKEELRVKPEQALVVTQILEAIYESGRTGVPVTQF